MNAAYDVVICGGGLAGMTLSLQLRQEIPELRVAVLERTKRPLPLAAFKIGESAVELGSMYLEDLGLMDNLRENHILKLGLRFFPGGGHLPLHQRAELGPSDEPRVVSYQIDRGRFEQDLRQIAEQRGVTLIEGAKATDVQWGKGDQPHCVSCDTGGRRQCLTARWVVDATGRNALLKRRLTLGRGSGHEASSGWFRMKGRIDITDMVPRDQTAWHEVPLADQRWRSTNHLMGNGYWMWLIPLSGDITSVGVVVHDDVHGFEAIHTLEKLQNFIREKEPEVARHLEGAEVLDFLCLSSFSHGIARSWSAERWGVVGVAGAFLDPLYSNGTDFIALANSLTTEVIRTDHKGGNLQARVRELNLQYHAEEPTPGFVGLPQWPSLTIDAHLALMKRMSPDQTLSYMKGRVAEGEEMVAELLLRVVQELGPKRGAQLLNRIGHSTWDLSLTPQRLAAESSTGLARRHALSKVARDVEHNLGRARPHSDAAAARELLATTPS